MRSRYPVLTVEVTGNDNDVLTRGAVGVFTQEYAVRVTAWAEKPTYEASRMQIQKLASRIEGALFKTVFPLVEPYYCTTLAATMEPEQDWIQVESSYGLEQPVPIPIYLDAFDARYPTQITEQISDNEFRIDKVYARRFYSGLTNVIRPRVHVYDSFCEGVTIDESPDNLLYAEIAYSVKVARTRYAEPFL
jgi:hypothetical protein